MPSYWQSCWGWLQQGFPIVWRLPRWHCESTIRKILGITEGIKNKVGQKLGEYQDWYWYLQDIKRDENKSPGETDPREIGPCFGGFLLVRRTQLQITRPPQQPSSRPQTRSQTKEKGQRSPSPEARANAARAIYLQIQCRYPHPHRRCYDNPRSMPMWLVGGIGPPKMMMICFFRFCLIECWFLFAIEGALMLNSCWYDALFIVKDLPLWDNYSV